MFWDPNKLSLGAVALGALLAAAPAAANVLVVRSAGPSAGAYPVGRSLPDNAQITLRAGDTLVVLGSAGTRSFRGPGTFSPGAAARAAARTIASSDGRRARIGAVRSAGIVPRGPTIWHVDVTQSGTFCLASAGNVMLWRPDASTRTTLTIAGPGGRPRTVQWAAGRATLAWPAGAPVANGSTYSFGQSGVAVPTQITFRILASEPADLEGVAAALIANGCQDQLDVLVESQPDLSAPGG
ncbi:MAG: hypothetical protein QOG13_281 [Sphingomonadales bacterium]|nr:hypothetical protein [Sphingomonadales bacterium]MEA3045049.1 hypothetical protein [Sphingomonadales bacterium]